MGKSTVKKVESVSVQASHMIRAYHGLLCQISPVVNNGEMLLQCKWKYSEKEFSESPKEVEPMTFLLPVGYVSHIQEPNL